MKDQEEDIKKSTAKKSTKKNVTKKTTTKPKTTSKSKTTKSTAKKSTSTKRVAKTKTSSNNKSVTKKTTTKKSTSTKSTATKKASTKKTTARKTTTRKTTTRKPRVKKEVSVIENETTVVLPIEDTEKEIVIEAEEKDILESSKHEEIKIEEIPSKLEDTNTVEINEISENEVIDNAKDVSEAIFQTENVTEAIKKIEQQKIDEDFWENEKIKKYNFFEPIIVIVLILVCFIGFYYFMFLSPKSITNSFINDCFDNANNVIDKIKNYAKNDSYNLSTEFSYESTNSNLDIAKSYKYKLDANVNSKENNIKGKLSVSNNDSTEFNTLFQIVKENVFLYNKDVYFYPIDFKINDYQNKISIDYNLLQSTLNDIKEIVLKHFEYSDSNKSKDNINVGTEDVKVNKLTIKFNKEDLISIYNNVKDDILKNDKIMNDLSSSLKIEKDDIKKSFESLNEDWLDNIQVIVYTKGLFNSYVGFEIKRENKLVLSHLEFDDIKEIKTVIDDNVLSYTYEDNKIKVIYSNIRLLTIDILKDEDNEIEFDYIVNSILTKYRGNIHLKKQDDNNYILRFSFVDSNDANINADITFRVSKSAYSDDYELNLSDSVNYTDLTKDELKDITNKIIKYFNLKNN